MKKIFALLLVALMLLPCIVSCGGGSVVLHDDEDKTLPIGSINSRDEYVKEDADRAKVYDGKTLDILATVWNEGDPGAPWSQAELTLEKLNPDNEESMASGFGREINTSLLKREQLIKDVYGVTLNWINSKGNGISNILTTNQANPAGEKYHIAMPRMYEAQTLVGNGILFNLANSPNIDLDKSYFNQVAREAYSVSGKTYFVAGDFSFLDESTANLIFFNVDMAKTIASFPNVYSMVARGEWTLEQMENVARIIGGQNIDGKENFQDTDKFGFGTTNLSKFYQTSGIQQVSVNEATGKYEISLNDEKVSTLVPKLIEYKNAEWARTGWTGDYGAMQKAFGENRLLFYNEVVQKFDYFGEDNDNNIKAGALPMPKLNADQETYYTPTTYQAVLMCVPTTTPSKNMSTYFLDVLSWTGQEYVMGYTVNEDGEKVLNGEGYYQNISTKVVDYKKAGDTMDMVMNYILANICYDVGYMHSWNGLLTNVQHASYSTENNTFQHDFETYRDAAIDTLKTWNENWAKNDY
ncbi:MAG: hypothetical protein IJ309_05835 [Clostridia bacterium]|nr:hypothetical protein [Clostridia bacterium]